LHSSMYKGTSLQLDEQSTKRFKGSHFYKQGSLIKYSTYLQSYSPEETIISVASEYVVHPELLTV